MPARWKPDLKWSDVTPYDDFVNRRQIMAGLGATALAAAVPAAAQAQALKPNSFKDITSYNNYYEFGTAKTDPAANAHTLTTKPWSVKVDGMVENPGDYSLSDLTAGLTQVDRIYRFRCVEAWSMVVPWNGFELGALLKKVGVKSGAKYVAFETLVRPEEMPGIRTVRLDWPYREGLRLDEAMNPLTLLATGIYDKPMPNQNGAPIRLATPWKYGFKSIKSIVRISLTDRQPPNTWNMLQPREYGFYSNVNPEVDHPRWSQATERPIGGGLLAKRVPTLMFNGYGDQVAHMYAGMDLSKNY